MKIPSIIVFINDFHGFSRCLERPAAGPRVGFGEVAPIQPIKEGNEMSTSLRYDPWSTHRDLLNEFNRFFTERTGNGDGSSGATADWAPAVDIEEDADKFVISADVPGVEAKSVEITLEGG